MPAIVFAAAAGVHAHHDIETSASSERVDPAHGIVAPKERAARLFFSDRRLIDQNGREVSFYSDVLKDKVVLINFIFTQCKDTCPLQSAKMSGVQKLLAARAGGRVHLISISVDPERDRPDALKAYASSFDAGANWTFLTGTKADVDDVVRRLGQLTATPSSHTTLFIAGNVRAGRWIKLHPDAAPETIAAHLQQLNGDIP